MAKGKTLIFSLGASGRLGPDLVLTKHGHTTVAARYKPPTDARSIEQLARRSWFAECVEAWHQLTPAQKEEYRLVDPGVGTNPAYLNFMREWLHMAVPLHATTHHHDEPDELDLQDLESSQVGESAAPLYNIVIPPAPILMIQGVSQGTSGFVVLNVRAHASATAVAAFIGLFFSDTGSAGANSFINVDNGDVNGAILCKGYHINASGQITSNFIALAATGNLQWRVQATGPNTATYRIRLLGWLEPVEV